MVLKEICALLAAGSMGAGTVVVVQQVKAPTAKARKAPARPVHRAAARPAAKPAFTLNDCPTVIPGGGGVADLAPIGPQTATAMANNLPPMPGGIGPVFPGVDIPFVGGGGSGGGGLWPAPVPSTPGGVPEIGTWAMMVSGIGLVGLALRRPRRQQPETKEETGEA